MSTTASLLALSGNITLPALGHLAYKVSVRDRNVFYALIAVVCFALTSVCTYIALQALTLGFVYASSAITQGLILFLGWYFLAEAITRQHIVAVLLISGGVLLFGIGSF